MRQQATPSNFHPETAARLLWLMRSDIIIHPSNHTHSVSVVWLHICLHFICLHPSPARVSSSAFSALLAHARSQTADVCCVSNGVKRVWALTSVQTAPGQSLDAVQIWIIALCRIFFFRLLFLKAQSVPLIIQSFG